MNRDEIEMKLHRISYLCGQIGEGPIISISMQNLVSTVFEIMTLVKEISVLRKAEKTAELERMP